MSSSNVKTNWDEMLLDKARFHAVLERIRSKLTPYQMHQSHGKKDELTIQWILANRRRFVSFMIKELKNLEMPTLSPSRKTVLISDKERVFFVSPVAEKILLMVCADILTQALEPTLSDSVYSFRKCRGNHQALFNLKEYIQSKKNQPVHVLKRDVSRYGDTIDRALATGMLERFAGYSNSRLYKHIMIQALEIKFTHEGVLHSAANGIPSGSPITPPMENLYLQDLDRLLESYIGSWYGRFGDDFVFATPNITVAKEVDQKIDDQMAKLKLSIKPSKKLNTTLTTNTSSPTDELFLQQVRFEWLGHSIQAVGTVGIKNKHYAEVKRHIKKEISHLIIRLAKFDLTGEQRLKTLRAGLQEILDISKPTKFSACIHRNFNADLLKDLDKSIAHIVVRNLRTHWKANKSQAWKQYKSVKARSIFRGWLEAKGHCDRVQRRADAA